MSRGKQFLSEIFSVYIDMGLSTNSPVVLTAVTSGQSFERSFSVQITQIECDSLSKGRPENSLSLQKFLTF